MFFVLSSFIVVYSALICCGPLRPCIGKYCNLFSEPTKFERKMTTVHDKYGGFLKRKTNNPDAPPSDIDPNQP